MRKRKTIRGAFYTNSEDIAAATLVSVSNDWWIRYYIGSDIWKIAPSGTANETASPVLDDSATSSIFVTPSAVTFSTTGETQQLAVVNQDSINVISECTFESDDEGVATVSAAGLITAVGNVGTCTVTATHNDTPTDTCAVEFA